MSFDRDRLVRCFEAVFPALQPAQIEAASAETIPEWDSLAAATLVALVEEQFGIQIQEPSLMRLTSFDAYRDLLREEHQLDSR